MVIGEVVYPRPLAEECLMAVLIAERRFRDGTLDQHRPDLGSMRRERVARRLAERADHEETTGAR
jgi:hypothetical protein